MNKGALPLENRQEGPSFSPNMGSYGLAQPTQGGMGAKGAAPTATQSPALNGGAIHPLLANLIAGMGRR